MILLAIIGALVLLIIVMTGVVVLTPVYLSISTDEDLYTVYQPGVFSIRFFPWQKFRVEVRIAGFKVPTKTSTTREEEQEIRPEKKRRPRSKRRSPDAWMFLVRKVIEAFRVRRFEMDLDTNDFALNAQLVPVLYFANRGAYSMNINFSGRNYLRMVVSVRPVKLIWAYLLFLTKK